MKQLLILSLLFTSFLSAKDYTKKREVRRFITQMVKYHHFNRKELTRLFRHVKYQKTALSVYVPSLRPKIKVKKQRRRTRKLGSWDRYEQVFLKQSKVTKGVAFMRKHRRILQKAYHIYGVEPEYIAAIIGIESHYGVNRGKYPVFDTLTTLAFEKNRRQKFYRKELKAFLLMTRREKVNPKRVKGSWACSIGLGQFMPSNYLAYVIDFNKDGYHQMNNVADAIGSIAHYLKQHGWQKGLPVATRVSYKGKRYKGHKTGYRHRYTRSRLKGIAPRTYFPYRGKVHLIKLSRLKYDELWYGTKNFYAITRYNHSDYYAMAVHQLAQRLKKAYKKQYGYILR
ncbi:MAG: lytic murein transglycosylase B [Sulfurovum sp.]|nr:lytic murein transglycosylase B [Sulfurovum sp.]